MQQLDSVRAPVRPDVLPFVALVAVAGWEQEGGARAVFETGLPSQASVAEREVHDAAERRVVRRGRIAVGAIFALHGTANGVYAGRLPWIQQHIHATPGVLGAVLVASTLGAITAAPATGVVIRRLGARTGMRVLIGLWTALLAFPALMPNAWSLAPVLFVFGAAAGCADVAMNAHAVRIERRAGKPIMSGLHGLWSVGMILGSAI